MSLIDFIQKIQAKPRPVRVAILYLSVFVSMLIIVPLWLVSFHHEPSEPKIEEELPDLDIPSLTESLKSSISAFFEKDLIIEELEEESQAEELEGNRKIKPAELPLAK